MTGWIFLHSWAKAYDTARNQHGTELCCHRGGFYTGKADVDVCVVMGGGGDRHHQHHQPTGVAAGKIMVTIQEEAVVLIAAQDSDGVMIWHGYKYTVFFH